VPPYERAPLEGIKSERAKRELASLTRAYNQNLTRSVRDFEESYGDIRLFLFDTNDLFHKMLDDPCSQKETCHLQDTTTFCEAYAHEHNDVKKYSTDCRFSADK
jgi:phospholipase/lecithinase/hemolysin